MWIYVWFYRLLMSFDLLETMKTIVLYVDCNYWHIIFFWEPLKSISVLGLIKVWAGTCWLTLRLRVWTEQAWEKDKKSNAAWLREGGCIQFTNSEINLHENRDRRQTCNTVARFKKQKNRRASKTNNLKSTPCLKELSVWSAPHRCDAYSIQTQIKSLYMESICLGKKNLVEAVQNA